jgi:hypothetical protein
MSEIIQSLQKAYTIWLGDEIQHPLFGRLQVCFIAKVDSEDYKVFCKLIDFNDTLRDFEGLDLVRIKYRRRTRMKVIK